MLSNKIHACVGVERRLKRFPAEFSMHVEENSNEFFGKIWKLNICAARLYWCEFSSAAEKHGRHSRVCTHVWFTIKTILFARVLCIWTAHIATQRENFLHFPSRLSHFHRFFLTVWETQFHFVYTFRLAVYAAMMRFREIRAAWTICAASS